MIVASFAALFVASLATFIINWRRVWFPSPRTDEVWTGVRALAGVVGMIVFGFFALISALPLPTIP